MAEEILLCYNNSKAYDKENTVCATAFPIFLTCSKL